MGSVGERRALGALVLAAAAFMPAAVAWACVPQATVSIQPTSGPSGTQATMSGSGWADRPVELRWGTARGPLLAETRGPSFSVPVTIPQAADGVHQVMATQRFPDHDFHRVAMFEVRSSPPPSNAPSARTPGRCSKLKGKRRSACVRRKCGRLRGARRRACVRRVTRRSARPASISSLRRGASDLMEFLL